MLGILHSDEVNFAGVVPIMIRADLGPATVFVDTPRPGRRETDFLGLGFRK